MPNIRNWPLAWKVAEQIIDHPETHDQGVYVTTCGTAACFAGWTAILSNCTFVMHGSRYTELIEVKGAPSNVHVAEKASELLGLDYDDEYGLSRNAEDLFDGGNDLFDILRLLTDWAEHDGTPIPERIIRVASWMERNDLVSLVDWDDEASKYVPIAGVPA